MKVVICDKSFIDKLFINLSGWTFNIHTKVFIRPAGGYNMGSKMDDWNPLQILFERDLHIVFETSEEALKFVKWIEYINNEANESFYRMLD